MPWRLRGITTSGAIRALVAAPSRETGGLFATTARDIQDPAASRKRDIKECETGLRRDIKELETGLRSDTSELATTTRLDMANLEQRLNSRLERELPIMTWGFITALVAFGSLVVAGMDV